MGLKGVMKRKDGDVCVCVCVYIPVQNGIFTQIVLIIKVLVSFTK